MHYKTLLFFILALFTLSCSDSKPDKLLEFYTDDLNNSTLATNTQRSYSVYAHFDNGEVLDVSSKLLWSSSNVVIATVKAGVVSSNVDIGFVDISYKTADKLSDGSDLHSNSMKLEVKDLNISSISLALSSNLFVGKTAQVKAEATFEDLTTGDVTTRCDWNSSNQSIATISSDGVIQGVSEGNTTIVALHRDANVSSTPLVVEVLEVKYNKIEIITQNTTFNVEQTLGFEVRGETNTGETIILDSSELIWSSSEATVVSVLHGIATALLKGSATISAVLKTDATLVGSVGLTIEEDEYMRLFDESGKELVFDAPKTHYFTKDTNNSLAKFTIKAVGKNFTISELNVTNFEGYTIFGSGTNYFDGLDSGDIIQNDDTNRTFLLKYDNKAELIYTFKIDDDVGSEFIQRYEDSAP